MGCGSSVPDKSAFSGSAVALSPRAKDAPLLPDSRKQEDSGNGGKRYSPDFTKELNVDDSATDSSPSPMKSPSPKATRDATPSPKASRARRHSKEVLDDVPSPTTSPGGSPLPNRGSTFRNRRLSKDEDSVHKGKRLAELGEHKENAMIAVEAAAAAGKILLVIGAACVDPETPIVSPRDALTSRTSVGAYSCHGMEPIDGEKGAEATSRNKINQDAACVAHALGGDETGVLLCVYDGHGVAGETVSKQVLDALAHSLFARSLTLVLTLAASLLPLNFRC